MARFAFESDKLDCFYYARSLNHTAIQQRRIFFGQNARLDLTGTFVGSTATGLKFADGNIYGSVNPQIPLLTMTTPVGLQFGSITGDITVTGATNFLTNYDGASLLFAGGNIRLTGSRLILPNGKVESAAVNDVGSIDFELSKLTDNRATSLTIPNGLRRGDITIQNGSTISTTGTNSGNINLQARDITVAGTDTATAKVNARSTGTANTQGGSVKLNATGDVLISGNFSGISTSTQGAIDGGDIQITARNLQILDVAYPLLPSIWDFLKLLALLPFQPVCKTQGILTSKLPNFSSKMGQLLPQVQSAAWVVRSRSQA